MVRFPIRLVDTFVSPQQPVSQPDEKNLSLFLGRPIGLAHGIR